MATKTDIFKPTRKEIALMEVMVNPDFLGKSITFICSKAKVDRSVYYKAIKKPGFNKWVNDMSVQLIKDKVHDVLKATYIHSLGPKGHNDRKLLLTMAGIYSDKQEVNLSGEVKTTNPLQGLTTEDLKKLIEK